MPKLAVFPAKSGAENTASLGIIQQEKTTWGLSLQGVFTWDMIDGPQCMLKIPEI